MSVHNFVAQFLKENGYHNTLKAFEAEYGTAISSELPHDETLESIVADRLRYLELDDKKPLKAEKLADENLQKIKDDQLKPWSAPYPETCRKIGPTKELVVDSALITIDSKRYALLATSGRSLIVLDLESGKEVSKVLNILGKVVVRRVVVAENLVLLCGMDGKLSVGQFSQDLQNFEVRSITQIHPRLVADMKVVSWRERLHLVSMGWDMTVKVHAIHESDGFKLTLLGEPYKLSSQGSSFDAVVYTGKLYVLVCKKEITLMDVLCMDAREELSLECRIALNEAQFTAAGFTPMCVKIFEGKAKSGDSSVPLVAVATSHEPYMRVLVLTMHQLGRGENAGEKDNSQILRGQTICNYNTMSPQDKFSNAQIAWREDGSGVWVIGDDGIIRGLDLVEGAVAVELKGHDGRIKSVAFHQNDLVSCGTDREVISWL